MSLDYYRILQVDPAADQEVVEAAYRRLARKYHPDLNADAEAGALMRQLNEAYAVLRDPTRRAGYDRQRSRAERRTNNAARRERARTTPAPEGPARQPRSPVRPRGQPIGEPPGSGGSPRPRPPTPPRPAATPEPVPLPSRGKSVGARFRSVGPTLRTHRLIAVIVGGGLLAVLGLAAVAASFFRPAELPMAPIEAPTAAVIVVNRTPVVEATPTFAPRTTPTAAPWPPFPLESVSPPNGQSAAAQGGPSAEAVGTFLSRAAREAQRRLLGGPRVPAAPATPVAPG